MKRFEEDNDPIIQMLEGGKVPGKAPLSGDSPKNDIVPAKLSPGEIVIKRSKASNPETAAKEAKKISKKSLSEGGTSSPTDTATETDGSSPGGASTGGVGSGIGGAGTGGAATGGASTGGAGTVTLTISGDSGGGKKGKGSKAPTTINISHIGGNTDAGNVKSGDGPGSSGIGGSGKGHGGGGGGAAPDEPTGFSDGGEVKPIVKDSTLEGLRRLMQEHYGVDGSTHTLEHKGEQEEAGNYAKGGYVQHYADGTGDVLSQIAALSGQVPPDAFQGQPVQPPIQQPIQQPVQQPSAPSIGDMTANMNQTPPTDYNFYKDISSEDRAKLYQDIVSRQKSAPSMIASGLGGLGDAIARSYGGQNTNFQKDIMANQEQQKEQALGSMDTQRQQRMQDQQGNIQMQLDDPKSPLTKSMQKAFRSAGINVGSLMTGSMLMKIAPDLGNLALKQATLGVQEQVANQNQANQVAGRHLEATKGYSAQPWYTKIPGMESAATKGFQQEMGQPGTQEAPQAPQTPQPVSSPVGWAPDKEAKYQAWKASQGK